MTPQAHRLFKDMRAGEWMVSASIKKVAGIHHSENMNEALYFPLWELLNLGLILKRKIPDQNHGNQYMKIPEKTA